MYRSWCARRGHGKSQLAQFAAKHLGIEARLEMDMVLANLRSELLAKGNQRRWRRLQRRSNNLEAEARLFRRLQFPDVEHRTGARFCAPGQTVLDGDG